MPIYKLIRAFLAFTLFFLFATCTEKKAESTEKSFSELYNIFERNRFAIGDSLKYCYQTADSLYNLNKNPRFNWLANQIKAYKFNISAEYDKSTKYYEVAVNCLENIQECDTLVAKSYNAIGNNYFNKAQYLEAITFFHKSLKINEKQKQEKAINSVKVNIARTYLFKGEANKAFPLLKEVSNCNFQDIKMVAMHNLANYYGEKGLLDSALYIDNKMINENINTKDKILLSPFYNNKGMCLISKNKMDSGLYFIQKSYEIDSLTNSYKNMGANLIVIGTLNEELGKYDLALEYYEKGKKIFNQISNKENLSACYKSISTIHKKRNEWQKAYQYEDSSNIVKREINNIELNSKIETLNIEFETQKKNDIIENQSLQLSNQKVIFYSVIVLFVFAMIVAYLFYQNNKSKNKLLLEQQQQNASLMIIESEQKERMRIARELHDGIGQKLTVLRMNASLKQEENAKQIELLDSTIQEVREISHKMMPEILNLGLIAAVRDLCYKVNTAGLVKCDFICDNEAQNLKLSTEIDLSIYRIVQEVVNNMLKHANAKRIEVNFTIIENNLKIAITDDGKGFDVKKINQSKGIGWSNIYTRARILKANLDVNSSDKGTNIVLNLSI